MGVDLQTCMNDGISILEMDDDEFAGNGGT